jgi:hypothetical protein
VKAGGTFDFAENNTKIWADHTDTTSYHTSVAPLPSSVSCLQTQQEWKYRVPTGSNEWISMGATGNPLYLTYGTPDASVVTKKRVEWVCQTAAGLSQITPCAHAIWMALLGSPPSFNIDSEPKALSRDYWLMMDSDTGSCIQLAELMRLMVEMLGIRGATLGFVYGSTDEDCFSISSDDFEHRMCPWHPGDPNYGTTDATSVLHLTMDQNLEVIAAFKCGSGLGGTWAMLAAFQVLVLWAIRRRRTGD